MSAGATHRGGVRALAAGGVAEPPSRLGLCASGGRSGLPARGQFRMTRHTPGGTRAEGGRGGDARVWSEKTRADRLADLCAQQQSPEGCAPWQRTGPDPAVLGPLCCRDSKIPEPPAGHRWKEVRFDHTVTWLASWTENIRNSTKYIMLNPSSRLKVRPAPGPLALGTQRGSLSTGLRWAGRGCPESGWK